MKKLLYIGLKFHQKTLSTKFFIDMLEKYYDIDFIICDQFTASLDILHSPLIHQEYDSVVLFQIMITKDMLELIKCQNITLIPMYDNNINLAYGKWREFNNLKFINFSKQLHNKLHFLGNNNTLHVQYAPKIFNCKNIDNDKKKVFFWQRATAINFNMIKKLLDFNQVESLHFHRIKNDFKNDHNFIMPSDDEIDKYNITFSSWFEDKNELFNKMKECDIFIAPRLYEGIGQAFLEAMALGKCVISPDNPTMNEYITHNENGILFDYRNPNKLDISNAYKLGLNAQKSIEKLHVKWLSDESEIISFIEQKSIKQDSKIASLNMLRLKEKLDHEEKFITDDLNMGAYKNSLSLLFSKYLNVLHVMLKDIRLNNEKIVIYGAGTGARLLLSIEPTVIKYIVDKNCFEEYLLQDKRVFSVEKLRIDKKPQKVLISVFGRGVDILKELQNDSSLNHHKFLSLDIDPYFAIAVE